jgi:hypothetical protein
VTTATSVADGPIVGACVGVEGNQTSCLARLSL